MTATTISPATNTDITASGPVRRPDRSIPIARLIKVELRKLFD